MDSKTTTVFSIVKAAMHLFRKNGFDATSIREIAATSNVSLGMINHYFGNKEFLGTQCLSILSDYCTQHLPERMNLEEDPILYDLVATRVLFQFLHLHGYSRFYNDSLKNDFFFKYLCDKPTVLVKLLSRHYTITASEDEIQLYSRYMPYMMEKTLILKKEMGLFPTIDYDQVPYLIVLTALNHFIPEQDIAVRNPESIRIANELVAPLDPIVPDSFLTEFVSQYIRKLQAANINVKNSWIQSMNQI